MAKCNEQLCHLYCDPLFFIKAKKFIEAAEKIYLETNVDKMGDSCVDYLKFVVKKSAFVKKSGLF